jgi:hypothetical protein
MRMGAAIGFALLLLLASLFLGGVLLTSACSENLRTGTSRAAVCDATTEGPRLWLVVLWPLALFGGLNLLPRLRRKPILAAGTTVVALVAFWIPVLLVASGES